MKSRFCRSATGLHETMTYNLSQQTAILRQTEVNRPLLCIHLDIISGLSTTQSFTSTIVIASSALAHLHLMLVIVWCVLGCVGVGDILD